MIYEICFLLLNICIWVNYYISFIKKTKEKLILIGPSIEQLELGFEEIVPKIEREAHLLISPTTSYKEKKLRIFFCPNTSENGNEGLIMHIYTIKFMDVRIGKD